LGYEGFKNGANWRFSKGLNRHFAVLEPGCPGSEAAKLPIFTSVDFADPQPPVTRQIGNRAPLLQRDEG
jgi:hypothetical protein